jgi:gamma-glutamyltranspeptidase/glutathione hydrolase
MSPTIVLDGDGRFVLATGSPGGNSIIAYTAKSIVAMLDWGLSPQEAAALPNIVARGDVVGIEDGFDPALIEALRTRGFTIEAGRGENSGIHSVRVADDGTLIGAADPRRDGDVGAP